MNTSLLSKALPIADVPDESNQQWIQLSPAGSVVGRDGRGPYLFNDLASIVRTTQERQGTTKMMIDYDHQSFHAKDNGKPAVAAGWIVGLQTRSNGIWALVEWTEQAAELIRTKAYRYISPAINHDKAGNVRAIINAALTNMPNIDGMAALASMETKMDQLTEEQVSELRAMLDLGDEAAPIAIMAAVRELVNAEPDPSKYVPIGVLETAVAEHNTFFKGVSEERATLHVEQTIRDGRMPPYMRDWAISLCMHNKPDFDAFLERAGPVHREHGTLGMNLTIPQTKRGGGLRSLHSFGGNQHTSVEEQVCKELGLTAEQFENARER